MRFAILAVVGLFAAVKPFLRAEKVASAAALFDYGAPPVVKT